MDSSGENTLPGVLDAEGWAVCPDCLTRINCGPSGLGNLEKQHRGTKICRETRAKLDKEAKKKRDGNILSFFTKPKAAPVPSIVSYSKTVKSYRLPPAVSPAILQAPAPKRAAIHAPEPIIDDFLEKFHNLIGRLPDSIPEATEYDKLALFSGNPEVHDNPSLKGDELWEVVNPLLKEALGWGMEGNMDEIIRRGRNGLDGLANFMKHFVVKRGVSIGLFEGKLSYLLSKVEEKIIAAENTVISSSPPVLGIDPTAAKPSPNLNSQTPEPTNPNYGPSILISDESDDLEEVEVIDFDSLKFDSEGALKTPKTSAKTCQGHVLVFPDGKSPHSCYPFALHDILVLPWNYMIRNGEMTLFARNCTGQSEQRAKACRPCQHLKDNKNLEGILTRLEDGVHENVGFGYHGFGGIHELLHRKNRQIEFYRLRGLNQAKKLLSKAAALSDQKRLLMAIASGKVNRVDRLLSLGLRQKKGVRGLLASYLAAAEGHYKPQSFTEEEAMKALLIWKLAGNRVANINHRANAAPSVSYLRSFSKVPPLIPSHGRPTIDEVRRNAEATLEGVLDVIKSRINSSVTVVHAVMMFDEIATEKRIRWDPKTNYFLGVCREHAHKTSMEFINEGDMEEVFRKLDSDEIHHAGEATVGAVGILCNDNRIYPGRPVLISGDCKRETGEQHAKIIQTVLDGVDALREKTKLRIVSIASDGETRRGSAFILLTFRHALSPDSPIYALLEPLKFLNLMVGDDDLTCDKDWKHIFKRWRNLLIRLNRDIVINGRRITADIIMDQFRFEGLSSDHIRALFNPEDLQDVKMAFDMLKDIWTLPRISTNSHRGFLESREALWILGKLLFHMVYPYLCVELSLSEQIEHLSAAAHLALALYRIDGKDFLPTNLYIDLMIMIKNVVFCVAKAKVDDIDGEFFLILQGTDRLEELFGILRTMVGNDANLDILQLVSRLAGTTEVSNILAKYPHWDRSPRRLKLSALTRDSKEIPDSSDHIKPASWRGNLRLKDVSLQTSWNRGRKMVEDECKALKPILQQLDQIDGVDILSPNGTLLFNAPLAEDDVDVSIESASPSGSTSGTIGSNVTAESNFEMRIEVEDAIGELTNTDTDISLGQQLETGRIIDNKVLIKGNEVSKARALSKYAKFRTHASARSTDRLKRVQDVSRFNKSSVELIPESEIPTDGAETLVIGDPISTLVRVEDQFWLCIGEVNGLRIDGRPVTYIGFDMLVENTVTVSYQMMGMRPATLADDPDGKHDWRTYTIKEHSSTVPGRLIQSINPSLSETHAGIPFYLFQSTFLVALTASLFQSLTLYDLKSVPKMNATPEYPYRENSGSACFVCDSDQNLGDIGELNTSDCPRCSPTIALDLTQGQRVLDHIGAHILFDAAVINSQSPLCGLCLRPSPLCQTFLTKGKGGNRNPQVDQKLSKGCLMKIKYSYGTAAKSSPSSPCSNVPIHCPICPKSEPAIWKYFMKVHFQEKHEQLLSKHEHLWKLSDFEISEMKKIWAKRSKVPVKRTKKSKIPPLVVSESHRAQIPIIDNIPEEPEDSDPNNNSSNSDSDEDQDVWSGARDVRNTSSNVSTWSVEDSKEGEDEEEHAEEGEIAGAHWQNSGIEDIERLGPSDSEEGMVDVVELPLNDSNSEQPADDTEQNTDDASSAQRLGESAFHTGAPTETETTDESSRSKRKRISRKMDLNGCLCGLIVNSSTAVVPVIRCIRKGCETQWYHVECIGLDQIPRKWVCTACEVSGEGRMAKRSRK